MRFASHLKYITNFIFIWEWLETPRSKFGMEFSFQNAISILRVWYFPSAYFPKIEVLWEREFYPTNSWHWALCQSNCIFAGRSSVFSISISPVNTLFFKRNATFLNPFFPTTLGHPWSSPLIKHVKYAKLQLPWVTDPDPGSCTSIYTLPKKKWNFPCCVSFETECTDFLIYSCLFYFHDL